MKTLDGQEPPGYFEGLTQQTMMRLEESSMHTDDPRSELGSAEADGADAGDSIRAVAARDEDSGLHDIRSLASSQRLRLSQRSSERSIRTDEDLLSAASGSWKAVALPEPAKMIAIAPLSDDEEEAADEPVAAKSAEPAPAKKKAAPKAAKAAAAKAAVEATAAAPAITAFGGARPAAPKKSPVVAIAGIGVLAAAGALIYVATRKEPAAPPPPPVEARAPSPEIAPLPAPPPVAPPPEEKAPEPVAVVAPEPAKAEKPKAPAPEAKEAKEAKKEEKKSKSTGQVVPDVVDEPKKEAPKKEAAKKPEQADPDFDKLLKEAGVQDKVEPEKPKLEKKSLSGDDIKAAMSAVAGKAQACYVDTQGSALVRLTVAPSGQIQSLTITGPFAGTPVASCVETAVRSATFPPWDGGPQNITYSYLLSE